MEAEEECTVIYIEVVELFLINKVNSWNAEVKAETVAEYTLILTLLLSAILLYKMLLYKTVKQLQIQL